MPVEVLLASRRSLIRARRLATALSLLSALVVATGCTREELARNFASEPELAPLYCYNTLGDPDCHAVPQQGQAKRLINFYGPAPAGPEGWRPPAALPEYRDAPPIAPLGVRRSPALPPPQPVAVTSPAPPSAPVETGPRHEPSARAKPAAAPKPRTATRAPTRLVPPE